jgi:hypothetical protein
MLILSRWDLDAQQCLFKLTMKSNVLQAMVALMALAFEKANPNIVNLIKRMWHVIHSSQLLFHIFPKYLKLIKNQTMVHVFWFY